MIYAFISATIFVLLMIWYSLRILIKLQKEKFDQDFKLRSVRNYHYPIFSQQQLVNKKQQKDILYRQISILQNQISLIENLIKDQKTNNMSFSVSEDNRDKIRHLAQLILRKNQADAEFDNMLRLNLSVTLGRESYTRAWSKAYDIVDTDKNNKMAQKYIKDYLERKIRLLNKLYNNS